MPEEDVIFDRMPVECGESELSVSGYFKGAILRVEVARIGGGCLDVTYGAGTQWVVNTYYADALLESVVFRSSRPKSHMDVASEHMDRVMFAA